MSVADHGPVGPTHTPLASQESEWLASDAELSAVMSEALAERDIDTLADAIAEKLSIERAFQASREDTFAWRMDSEFGGDAA